MLRPGIRKTRIRVWAARGGHGATTVAGALGAFLGAQVRSHDPEALEWLWPGGPHYGPRHVPRVMDAGVLSGLAWTERINLVVLRGPCSLAVRSLVSYSHSIDHLVVIREAWRPIRRDDVEAALSMRVSAEIVHSPRVARLADAGLLDRRVDELEEFAELKAWATAQWSDPAQDPTASNLRS